MGSDEDEGLIWGASGLAVCLCAGRSHDWLMFMNSCPWAYCLRRVYNWDQVIQHPCPQFSCQFITESQKRTFMLLPEGLRAPLIFGRFAARRPPGAAVLAAIVATEPASTRAATATAEQGLRLPAMRSP